MKNFIFIFIFTLAILIGAPAQADDKKIYVYTWDTYLAPDLFKKFEDETGIKVIADIYSSNDALLAKLQAGGAYDVIMPTGNYIPAMVAEKLVQPLPAETRALVSGMIANVQKAPYDVGNTYSLPLFFGTTALAVNTKLVKEDITSWQQYFTRPAGEAASLGVLDDVGTAINIASLALGKNFCDNTPETLKAIQALLTAQKPFVKTYGATGYLERMAANDTSLQMAWSGDVFRIRKDNKDVKYVYPKEGVEIWTDNLAIPASAQNLEGAKKFIAFVLRPENMAAYADVSGNVPTVALAKDFLSEELKTAAEFNIPEGTKTGISLACDAATIENYNKIWEKLLQ